MTRAAVLACISSTLACTAPADPKPTGATPGATPGATSDADPAAWRRGTVTVGPDGTHAIHADDDSVTVCAPELAPELRAKGLALRFRGELIPPAPGERRWCTLARDLEVQRAE